MALEATGRALEARARKLSDGVRRRNTIWESAMIRYTESTREPDDFSRNTNTAPGATQAMITHKKPTTDEHKIAM